MFVSCFLLLLLRQMFLIDQTERWVDEVEVDCQLLYLIVCNKIGSTHKLTDLPP